MAIFFFFFGYKRSSMEAAREEWRRRAEEARDLAGAGEAADRAAKSVGHLLSQVSTNTRDLDQLQDRVDKTLARHVDVREEIIRKKDEQIQGFKLGFQERIMRKYKVFLPELQDKLKRSEERRESELIEAKAGATETERRLKDKELELEKREGKVRKMEVICCTIQILNYFQTTAVWETLQVETDSSRRRFRTERELERTRIEEEKKKVQVQNVIQKYCPGYT